MNVIFLTGKAGDKIDVFTSAKQGNTEIHKS